MPDRENVENRHQEEFPEDVERLTKTELRTKYQRAYTSWRNGKQRTKGTSNWAAEFEDFRDFLLHMGPPPEGKTLDRIDNNNPQYGPGLCRWATKTQQANNRRTTLHIEAQGKSQPLSIYARERGELPNTVRKRSRRYDDDLHPSPRHHGFGQDPRLYQPWSKLETIEERKYWERSYRRSGCLVRGISRHEYIIEQLAAFIAREQASIERLPQPGCEEEDEIYNEKFSKHDAEIRRLKQERVRLRQEQKEWKFAVEQADLMRSPDFLEGLRKRRPED